MLDVNASHAGAPWGIVTITVKDADVSNVKLFGGKR